jgi:hypothetical protein
MIRRHFFFDNIPEFEKSQSRWNRLENSKLVGKEWQSSLLMQRAEGTKEEEQLHEEVARKALVISVSDYDNKGLQPPDFCKKDEGNAMILPHSLVRVITLSSGQKSALFILEPHRGQVPPLNL